ncbi:MAG: nuclear transport factor 2 family protein [Mesorhizobium sp.]|nr:MAG: nuclear transport factor 2 family protein [Mesorhizobium sp.]
MHCRNGGDRGREPSGKDCRPGREPIKSQGREPLGRAAAPPLDGAFHAVRSANRCLKSRGKAMDLQNADPADEVRRVIEDLEQRRYSAMLASDVATLADLLDDELVYTHSFGERDDKAGYLKKVETRFFVYHEIHHSSDRIIVRESLAVVAGTMRAKATVGAAIREIDNSCMAVWGKSKDRWRLIAYQPTPMRK